jgi:thiamine biosynthesis protein ThiS
VDLKTLADLVTALGLEPRMILIEHNGQATRRADWAKIPVAENDRVEILQVAAGG